MSNKKLSKYVTYEENEEILKKYFEGRIKNNDDNLYFIILNNDAISTGLLRMT